MVGALVVVHAPSSRAAPPRGYEGPGHIESGEGEVPTPVEPIGTIDPGEPSDAPKRPVATDAAATSAPAKPPEDLAANRRETWMPRHRIIYRNLVAARANPVGFVDEITLGYRYQLVKRDTPLFRDSFLLAGAHGFLTPAFVRVGPTLEVQPLGILNLSATYDFVGYFGAFDQLQSFRTPTAQSGPDDLRKWGKEGRDYATWGHLVTLSALLQLRVRNFAFRNQLKFYWAKVDLRGNDTVFFDFANDILQPNNGWVLTNDSDALLLLKAPVAIAVRHTLTHAFYTQDMFLFGEPVSNPNGPTSRIGPGIVWTLFDYPGARFNKPALILLAQWWLRHRWRTGEQIHPALPYAVIGFQFEGDLWKPRERPRPDVERRRERRRRR